MKNKEEDEKKSVRIYSSPVTLNEIHTVYFPETVEDDGHDYTELFELLSGCKEKDGVLIRLANYGGDVQLGLRICCALRNTLARVLIHVEAPCYSMASVIALSGHDLIMNPHTFLMFHAYSGTKSGKAAELASENEHYNRHFWASIKHFCSPFLTEKEIKKLQADGDVYVHESDKDLKSRIRRHFK